MKFVASSEPATEVAADALVLAVYQGAALEGEAAAIDKAMDGLLSRLIEQEEIKGSVGEVTVIPSPSGVAAERLVIGGLGKRSAAGRRQATCAIGAAVKSLATKKRGRIAVCVDGWTREFTEAGVCAAAAACRGQDILRADKKLEEFDELLVLGAEQKTVDDAAAIAAGVNLTRTLVNEPANRIYPATFAEEAERVASEVGIEVEVWDKAKLEEERCGSLLGVSQGSSREPRLVILRYNGGGSLPRLALVGKGVTFDSGGLSLKPSDSMKTMKCDMAGAATVLGAITAIAQLDLPVNVTALVGLTENMVSGDSYKLGDVLTSRSGKTIEVLNTDAEGRLVLADVLDVALQEEPEAIIDLATLTGACVVALGMDVCGLMTNDAPLCHLVRRASEDCGEPSWELPMFPFFSDQIKSNVADIKNIGDGRWGGAITAAKFLEEFVGATPWTHVDIAGPAFSDSPKAWIDGGASGVFVRSLVEVARRWDRFSAKDKTVIV